jgi:hypothetical protein
MNPYHIVRFGSALEAYPTEQNPQHCLRALSAFKHPKNVTVYGTLTNRGKCTVNCNSQNQIDIFLPEYVFEVQFFNDRSGSASNDADPSETVTSLVIGTVKIASSH